MEGEKIEQETYFSFFLLDVHTQIETCSLSSHNLYISYDFTVFNWNILTVAGKHFYRIQ